MKTTMMCALGCLAVAFGSTSAFAAVADGGLEFSHRPADDGAGYLIQPLGNLRVSGAMAYEVGQSITVPDGFGTFDGTGVNTGNGTYKYTAAGTWPTMAIYQDRGDGGDGNPRSTPPINTPLNNARNTTMEARFKVSGNIGGDGDLFNIDNDAYRSIFYDVAYGRRNGNLGIYFNGEPNFDFVPVSFDGFVKLRICTEDLGGGFGRVRTFYDREDNNGFQPGPTGTYAYSQTRDEGIKVKAIHPATWSGDGPTRTAIEVDYIRWKLAKLPTSEGLSAVPEPASLGAIGMGIAGLLMARRRS